MIGSDSVLVQIDNLPPYSPDLNPIEMAFSKLKALLRRTGARTFDQIFDAFAESVICSHRRNAGIASAKQEMDQVKGSML